MAISESHSPVSLHGVGNFYRSMLFGSLILLVLVPLAVFGLDVWLNAKEAGLDGELAALDAERTSLSEAIVADSNAVAALEAEVMDTARSEQIFATDSEPRSIWRPDSRWSEMGKAHIMELWDRQNALRSQIVLSRTLLREKTAEHGYVQARKTQVLSIRTWIQEHKISLYAALLTGGLAIILFAVLWGMIVQTKVNDGLARWASR